MCVRPIFRAGTWPTLDGEYGRPAILPANGMERNGFETISAHFQSLLNFAELAAPSHYSLPVIPWHNVARALVMNSRPNEQIGDWLGRKPPATEADLLRIVEERLAPTVVNRLISLGLERSEIDATVIPLRTLQHRRSRREKLTVEESDRVLRVIRAVSMAESVYGTRQRALEWLRKANSRLEGRSPLSLLKTDMGSRIVEELLIQIDERHVRLNDPMEDQPPSRPQWSRRIVFSRSLASCRQSHRISGGNPGGCAP